MNLFRRSSFVVAALAVAACSDNAVTPLGKSHVPSGGPRFAASGVSGATFTTNNLIVDNPDPNNPVTTCLNGNGDANAINCNIYADKQFVWLTGGPTSGGSALENGTYFFAVLDPGGQKNDVNDGQRASTYGGDVNANKNLSDEHDAYTNRTFVVQDGRIISYGGSHEKFNVGTAEAPDYMIRLMDYSDTQNHGGEYDMAICQIGPEYDPSAKATAVSAATCKYDNFKVRTTTEPPPPPQAALTVTKTVAASYARSYKWAIAKSLTSLVKKSDNTALTGVNGVYTIPVNSGTLTANYKVDVNQADPAFVDDSWKLTGKITVTNTSLDGYATISDLKDEMRDGNALLLSGGTLAFSNCSPSLPTALNHVVLPDNGGVLSCDYTVTFAANPDAGPPLYGKTFYNTASVSAVLTPGGTETTISTAPADAYPFSFGSATVTENDKCVTVSDTFNGGSAQLLGTVCVGGAATQAGAFAPPKSFSVSKDIGPFDGGDFCGTTTQVTNSATYTSTTVNSTVTATTTPVNISVNVYCQGCTIGYWKANDLYKTAAGAASLLSTALAPQGANSSTADYFWGKNSPFKTQSSLLGDAPAFNSAASPPNGVPALTTIKFPWKSKTAAMSLATFDQALNFSGGYDLSGQAQNLMRQATGALLNINWNGGAMAYPLSRLQLITLVNTAINDAVTSGNPSAISPYVAKLDSYNSQSCILNSRGEVIAK